MLKQRNNHGAAPSEDARATARAFLRLGNVLAEIANDLERKEANINQNTARNKDDISTNRNETGGD